MTQLAITVMIGVICVAVFADTLRLYRKRKKRKNMTSATPTQKIRKLCDQIDAARDSLDIDLAIKLTQDLQEELTALFMAYGSVWPALKAAAEDRKS